MHKLTEMGVSVVVRKLVVLAALAAFATTASAGTVNVFAEYIGTTAYTSKTITEVQTNAYKAFLGDNNIDFGFFCGPSSSGNFGFTHSDYAKSASDKASGRAGFHIFVYKTSRWRLLSQYNMSIASNSSSSANACVVEDKTTGEQFAFIMYTTTSFGYSSGGTPAGPIITMRNNCSTDYPNARVLIGVTKTYGLFDGSQLNAYLVNQGFTQARSGTSCGAIYCQNHASRSGNPTAASVSWLSGAAELAALATVTYRQQFTIAFEDWDGTSLGAAQTVYAGEDATPPADPTREGYTFTGWSGSYQNVQASATLTAQYAINTYTVRFLDWDGSVLKSETVNHGSDATPPADPTREGFRFTGWQGDYTGITAATDITATYVEATAVTHWVTFYDWDNTQLSQQEIVEGEDATPPANPDNRPGWHFTSWQGNYTGVMQDETVTAQYAINTYVVTFQDWDGTELKTETVEHGSDATPPANPTRTGWHFTGWSGTYQNIQAATTITAQYEIDTFTVTFQYTNGVVIVQQTVNYQAAATPPANPAPIEEDTVFYRWDGSYSSITEDTTVTAIFVPNVIEIGTGAEFAEYMASSLVSLSGVTFAFTNDISMSGVTYTRPSEFSAALDGRGHTLTRLSLHKDRPSLIHTLKGTVRDLTIAGYNSPGNVGGTSLIASASRGGTLSGVILTNCTWSLPSATPGTSGFIYDTAYPMSTITNCWLIDCKVIGNNATRGAQVIGGFVAKAAQLKMVDCHVVFSDTNVVSIGNGIPTAGAFIGQTAAGVTIERCSNNARVKVASSVAIQAGGAGGFVGVATSSGSPTIRDCANFGTVESTVPKYPAGGFIGDVGTESDMFSLTVQSCFNYGAVSSPIAAGGLIGRYRGVVSTLSNNGNSGAISSEAGFAGGLVGQICYNDANRTWRICNAMQAGAVSTTSGGAGLLVGCIEESDLAGLTLSVSNTWIAGSAATEDGGRAGILFGGRDITAENELAVELRESKVLESNASLPHYYDRSDEPASLEEAPATFGADALGSWTIRNALNAYAQAHGHTMWIQGESYPELETFGTEHVSGFMIIVR